MPHNLITNFIRNELRHVFLFLHRKELEISFGILNRMRRDRRQWDIYPEDEIDVFLPCTPVASYDQLRQIYMDGLMKKETLAKHTFNIFALPSDEIELQEYPDKFPKELYNPKIEQPLKKTPNKTTKKF